MKRQIVGLLLVLLWWPLLAAAATYEVQPGMRIVLPELPASWQVSREASPAMVEHLTEHVREEAAEKGKALTDAQALELARKRLESEELFLFNPHSGAHVQISFTALEKDEQPPSRKSVALSAKYAASGVGDEGWQVTGERHREVAIAGAQTAQRFEIDFTHDDEAGHFVGVVGFAHPYWFWIYATDHGKDPTDQGVIDSLMTQVRLHAMAK